jgi:hypothetical protein
MVLFVFAANLELLKNCLLQTNLGCLEPPIPSCPHGDNFPVDTREIEQMLLNRDPALLVVDHALGLARPKLNVQISSPLIQDISLQLRFDLFFPYRFWYEMQVLLETTGYDYSRGELSAKFRRQCQPTFIV